MTTSVDAVRKFAVVGFGKLGLLHAALINGIPGCKLVAVVDSSSVMLDMLKVNFSGIHCFTDHREMLAKMDLDGVFICTPTHLHTQIAQDCVEKKVAVFIEKPLSHSSKDAKPLLESLKKSPVVNMVGHMRRYMETFAKAKELIAANHLGKIHGFRSNMYVGQLFKPGKGWRYSKETSGGGVLITQNSHLIDMLMWYFGDISWASGQTRSFYSKEVEDAAHAYLAFKNGAQGWLDASWSQRHHRTLTMEISVEAENGNLIVNDDEVQIFLDDATRTLASGWHRWKKPDLYRGVSVDVGGAHYTLQSEDFIASIKNGQSPGSDVAFAYRVQKVIEAIYASADKNGAPVNLEYDI